MTLLADLVRAVGSGAVEVVDATVSSAAPAWWLEKAFRGH